MGDNTDAIKKCLKAYSAHPADRVYAADISSDGSFCISAAGDSVSELNTVMIIESLASEIRHVLKGHKNMVYDAVISADDNLVLSGSLDRTLKLWDVSTVLFLKT